MTTDETAALAEALQRRRELLKQARKNRADKQAQAIRQRPLPRPGTGPPPAPAPLTRSRRIVLDDDPTPKESEGRT